MTFLPDSPRKIFVTTWWIGSSYRACSLSLYCDCSSSLAEHQLTAITERGETNSVIFSSRLISSSNFSCMTRKG